MWVSRVLDIANSYSTCQEKKMALFMAFYNKIYISTGTVLFMKVLFVVINIWLNSLLTIRSVIYCYITNYLKT